MLLELSQRRKCKHSKVKNLTLNTTNANYQDNKISKDDDDFRMLLYFVNGITIFQISNFKPHSPTISTPPLVIQWEMLTISNYFNLQLMVSTWIVDPSLTLSPLPPYNSDLESISFHFILITWKEGKLSYYIKWNSKKYLLKAQKQNLNINY